MGEVGSLVGRKIPLEDREHLRGVARIRSRIPLKVLPADADGDHGCGREEGHASAVEGADNEVAISRAESRVVNPEADPVTNLHGTLRVTQAVLARGCGEGRRVAR